MTGESHSRVDINLPGVQEELIKEIVKTGKPVVVLMMSGRPMTFKWTAANAPAILYTWFLGCESGNAIADVLFGDYNPSAKLPVTIPRAVGQVPIFYASRSTGRPVLDEKEIEDHSAYIDEKITPQYAFGHGLSYSNFEYSNLKISKTKFQASEKITITFDVKNNSKFDGEEIAQLYIHDIAATVARPVKELKDFKKVLIKGGATHTISFMLDKEKLSFYNQQLNFIAEPGEFEIMVGAASDNIKLQGKVEMVE
jgi:beta-glucosidase